MENLDIKQLAFLARAMYSSGRNPNQICYLLCLKYKGELSIDELSCYMAGLINPRTHKPVQRQNVYSTMYALEQQCLVLKDKAQSEEGKSCNLYTISSVGEKLISELVQVGSSWEQIQGHVNMLSMFGTSNIANTVVTQDTSELAQADTSVQH